MLTALRCEKGDTGGNLAAHVALIKEAAARRCDHVLFPEMSLSGSVDPATNPERLLRLDDASIDALVAASRRLDVGISFGIGERAPSGDAYISHVVVTDGATLGVQRKRYLGEGEESFTPGVESRVFEQHGERFAVAMCAEAGFDQPFDAAAAAHASLVFFPSTPGLYGRRDDDESWRRGFSWWEQSSLADASRHARRLGIWVALSGQAGSTVDEDFPGLAALVDPAGNVVARLPDWREGTLVVTTTP